jgi:hypothetical protein
MKKFLEEIEAWRQTVFMNVRSSLNINEADLVKLRSHSPRLEGFFRRLVPSKYIENKGG